MLKVVQSTPTTEIWQEALRHQVITESGCWNYLAWNAKERKAQPMSKRPVSMTSMQSILENWWSLSGTLRQWSASNH